MSRKSRQVLRAGGQHLDYGHVKPNPDGKLDDHGTQAPDGIHSRFLIEAHSLLGEACPIFGVAALECLNLGLHLRHLPGRAELPQGQRYSGQAHQDGEDDYGYPKVVAKNGIQHHQPI